MDNFFSVPLQVVGSLALFIFGMKMMSGGIQRAAGDQLRNVLRVMTKNRFLGVFTGFFVTALVQSSSATTVMTVSFVNAGLLTLVESAGLMMGANIGTTITSWIISVLGFEVNIGKAFCIPLFAIGVPLIFANKPKLKYWGEFIIGFSILFLGLYFLKDAFPPIDGNSETLHFLESFTKWGIFSRIFFVFIGAIITILVQSSSAAMAITITMAVKGWLPFDVAAAMILGENIGTTITAEFAALVGNTNAKRSARIHSLFNIIGVVWMIILMPFILYLLGSFMEYIGYSNPMTNNTNVALALSGFHTFFNFSNMILLLGFVQLLVRIATWSIPDAEEEEKPGLLFINTPSRTPELATIELQKETAHFGEITSRMSGYIKQLVNSTEPMEQEEMLLRLEKYEKITDHLEIEITEYITKLSNYEITPNTSRQLRKIITISNELEQIGDIYFQISRTIAQKIEDRIYFTPDQRNNLNEMIGKIDEGFKEMTKNLNTPDFQKVTKDNALRIEKEINQLRNKLRNHNLTRLGEEDYNVKSSMVYNNVFTALEKVGDHLLNITEAIVGEL